MVVKFFLLQENVQYERVAGIADTVQRDWGCFLNKQICEDCTEGENRENE